MKFLIVEDEHDVAWSLARTLARDGYAVDIAETAGRAIESIEVHDYDLMVLDLNLPDRDGLEVCRIAREKKPKLLILILTARRKTCEVTTGLDQGADDYLTKPFHLQEILARIRALLRRDLRCRDPLIRNQELCLDTAGRVAWIAGRKLDLTRKEYAILEYLMRHPGEVVSQEALLEHVWCSSSNAFSNTIRVHIRSLRQKLGDNSDCPKYIITIIGEGYQFLKPGGMDDEYGNP